MLPTRLNNFKRAYNADRWYRQHFTPAGQLLMFAVVASGVLGFDTSRNLSHQIFSVLLALVFLAMVFSRFNRSQFQCERSMPTVATVGQAFSYQIRVTNQSSAAYSDILLIDILDDCFPTEDELQHYRDSEHQHENRFDRVVGYPRWARLTRVKAGAVAPSELIRFIPAKQSVDLQLRMTPLRRGYLHIHGTRLGNPDPTGLFRAVSEVANTNSLLVLPQRYPVPNLYLSGHRNHQVGGVALSSSIGESSEFHGLREYQAGDPLRRIHWRSWARQGKPMVKTYEDEFFVRHALILDTYAGSVSVQVFEAAVSVAASIALNVSDQESLLDLMFVEGKAYQFTSGRGVGDIQSMLEILACVQAENSLTFDSLAAMVLDHLSHLSSVIFVLLEWDEARQALVQAVKQSGIEFRVLLITESGDDILDVDFMPQDKNVVQITVGNIEQGLAQLV